MTTWKMTKASCHFIPGFFEPNEKYLVFAIDSKKNFIIKNKKSKSTNLT